MERTPSRCLLRQRRRIGAVAVLALCAALVSLSPPISAQQTQRQTPRAPAPPGGTPPPAPPGTTAKPAPADAQIFGLPRVGEEGATAEDVELLQRAARKFIAEGKCTRIDYGDRSQSRMGWFIISCDGHNVGFRREDIDK